jgi:hypothetical protein
MLLQPRVVPGGGEQAYGTRPLAPTVDVAEDLETVSQGVGDRMTRQPVRECLVAPYPRQEEYSGAGPFGSATSGATPSGKVWADADVYPFPFGASVGVASAYVGHDFQVPAGIVHYTTTVDYDYSFNGFVGIWPGVAVVSLNVAISIDRGDAQQPAKSAHAIHLLSIPVIGSSVFSRARSETATEQFSRGGSSTQSEPANGTVRVMVGVEAHCVAIGVAGEAWFTGDLTVRQICVNSAV